MHAHARACCGRVARTKLLPFVLFAVLGLQTAAAAAEASRSATAGKAPPPLFIRDLLRDGECTAGRPCAACEGECDDDGQCAAGLACFRRSADEPVPGCGRGGGDDQSGYGYCHSPQHGSASASVSASDPPKSERSPCTGMLDSSLPTKDILREVRACGFAYISPGWLPQSYIAEAHAFAQRYGGDSPDAYASNAGGGRRDVIPPFEGPFAKARPFQRLSPKFYDLLLDIVGNSEWDADPEKGRAPTAADCCDLFLLELKYAVALDEVRQGPDCAGPDEPCGYVETRRQRRHLTPQGKERMSTQPWHRDHSSDHGHYYVFVALHNITAGTVAVIPNSQPGTHVDDIGCGSPLNRLDDDDPRKIAGNRECDTLGYAPDFTVPAGAFFIHEAALTHKGLANTMADTRYFMRYDVMPANSNAANILKHGMRWHGTGENGGRNRRRSKMFSKAIAKAKKNRAQGVGAFTASLFEL